MTPPPFAELTKKQRRRLLGRAAGRVLVTTAILFLLFYLLPVDNRTETSAVVLLVGGLVVFLSVLSWQVRQIIKADYPGLRAVESAGTAVPLLIVVFAFVYLNLATGNPGTFTQPLSRSGAIYFTVTVLSTVGFGDITPVGDTPRLIVSLQMILDLVLIGFILRLLTGAARTGIQRRDQPDASPALGVPEDEGELLLHLGQASAVTDPTDSAEPAAASVPDDPAGEHVS
jgi:voltage-gated potassium channel